MEDILEKSKRLNRALDDIENIKIVFSEALRADVDELYEIVSDEGIGDNCFDDICFGADDLLSWHEKFIKGMEGYNQHLLDRLYHYASIANHARWLLQFRNYFEKEVIQELKQND